MSHFFTVQIPKNQDVALSSQAQLSTEVPSFRREHYDLSCWLGSNGKTYTDTINVGQDTIISAQWRGERLSVSYDPNYTADPADDSPAETGDR